MNQPLANTRVVITFPYEGEGTTGPKVFEVFINDIAAAIRTNAKNAAELLEIRRTLCFLTQEVRNMEAELAHPDLLRKQLGVL